MPAANRANNGTISNQVKKCAWHFCCVCMRTLSVWRLRVRYLGRRQGGAISYLSAHTRQCHYSNDAILLLFVYHRPTTFFFMFQIDAVTYYESTAVFQMLKSPPSYISTLMIQMWTSNAGHRSQASQAGHSFVLFWGADKGMRRSFYYVRFLLQAVIISPSPQNKSKSASWRSIIHKWRKFVAPCLLGCLLIPYT